MARLALSVAGGLIGNAIPGVGFSYGWLAGTILGRLLLPPEGQDTFDTKLGDNQVSTSVYGIPLVLSYGTVRLKGNMIWSTPRETVSNTQEVGGKGGLTSGPTHTSYSYFRSFAMSFTGREAEQVLRIWANATLIYDATGSTTFQKAGLKFRFYPGSETQMPDALIEAHQGEDNTSAYRDHCYIVFERFPLDDYGGQVPNIEAEIAHSATAAHSVDFSSDIGDLTTAAQTTMLAVDHKRRRIYAFDTDPSDPTIARVYDMDTLVELRQVEMSDITKFGGIGNADFMPEAGYLVGERSNTDVLAFVDPDTLKLSHVSSSNINATVDQVIEALAVDEFGAYRPFAVVKRGAGIIEITDPLDGNTLEDDIYTTNVLRGICPGLPGVNATAWAMRKGTGNSAMEIYKITIYPAIDPITDEFITPPLIELAATIPTSTWDNNALGTDTGFGPLLDPLDGGLILGVDSASAGNNSYMFKWIEGQGVVWAGEYDAAPASGNETFLTASELTFGTLAWVDSTGRISMIYTDDGTAIIDGLVGTSIDSDYNPGTEGYYDSESQTLIHVGAPLSPNAGILHRARLNRYTGAGESLATVVEDIATRCGLDPNVDLDTSELTDTVRGYIVSRQINGRSAIEPLMQTYLFDAVQSDWQVKFPKRGKASIATIEQVDLIANDDGEILPGVRSQDLDLPMRVTFRYMDKTNDYQQGAQSAKRVVNPYPVMRSKNERSIDVPIVLTASEAYQVAEQWLFSDWNERIGRPFKTSHKWAWLDAGDVVTINLENGNSYEVKITNKNIRADLSVDFQAVHESASTFVSDGEGDSGSGFQRITSHPPVDTKLMLLNLPLLRDIDDTGGVASRNYYGMSGYRDGWESGILYQSLDSGVSFAEIDRINSATTYGTVSNKLPTTTTPFRLDSDTTLEVFLVSGELESITEAQFYNNVNVAAIGSPASQNWEIILFQNATETAGGVYELTNITRARRGTDPFVDTHNNGEMFVFLNRATISAFLLTLSQVDTGYSYKGVGHNQYLHLAETVAFTGLGRDLMPYAPDLFTASAAGGSPSGTNLGWTRRTRFVDNWDLGVGNVAVGEASEEYEVEIKDAGGTVVRTVTGLTSPSYFYSDANATADGLTVPLTSIRFEVFQVSAAVGRGFGHDETITL